MSEKKKNYNHMKLLTLLDLLLLHQHLCRCLLCSQVGRYCEDLLVRSQATHIIASKSDDLKQTVVKQLRTSPSGLKILAVVPVGLSIGSDESSASTTCKITDVANLRFEAYITKSGTMSSKYLKKKK
jgi:hypothetical protein